jgi:hypothetical protein
MFRCASGEGLGSLDQSLDLKRENARIFVAADVQYLCPERVDANAAQGLLESR